MGKQTTLPAPSRDGQAISAEEMQAYLGDETIEFTYKGLTNYAVVNKLQISPGVALNFARARSRELLASHESNKRTGLAAELKALANKVDAKISEPKAEPETDSKAEKKKRAAKLSPEAAPEVAPKVEAEVSPDNLAELTDELMEKAALMSLHEIVDTAAETDELYQASVDLALAALVQEDGEPVWTVPAAVLAANRDALLNTSGLSQSFVRSVVAWFDPTSPRSAAVTQNAETQNSDNSSDGSTQTES
jgi:hypothetical protein